jgi:hypothetical protein
MPFSLHRYFKIALFNLLLVAAVGVTLRYKIAFSLPFVDQKYLLHGHSHFAFSGWVTHALIILLVAYLAKKNEAFSYKKYKWVINANLFTAYGMLISFPLQGYGLFSIIFSTLSIFTSYAFVILYWKDLSRLSEKSVSHWWIKAALLFNVISSAGVFALVYMMATHNVEQHWYLGSVYFFLHFQYNGWFLFTCIGLMTDKFLQKVPRDILIKIFWLFAAACIPAYFLSILWLPVPWWIYTIIVMAAFSQFTGWLMILKQIKNQLAYIRLHIGILPSWILIFSAAAFSIKLLLQLGSTIPFLSTIAFGFRPIVIGYLHLILLGVITLFLLGFMMAENYINSNSTAQWGIKIFTGGVIINELFLMLQGVAAMNYTPVPYINESLLVAAGIIFTGIFLLLYSQKHKIF